MPQKKPPALGQAVIEQMEVEQLHEPRTLKGRPRTSHGVPAKYELPDDLVERFVAFVNDDDWLSLKDEIGLLRAILAGALIAWKNWSSSLSETDPEHEPPAPPMSLKELGALIENLGKMVERQHRMMYSDNNLITLESAAIFALSVASLVNKFVKDPEEKVAVLEGIRQLLTTGQGFSLDLKVVRKLISPVKESFDE